MIWDPDDYPYFDLQVQAYCRIEYLDRLTSAARCIRAIGLDLPPEIPPEIEPRDPVDLFASDEQQEAFKTWLAYRESIRPNHKRTAKRVNEWLAKLKRRV